MLMQQVSRESQRGQVSSCRCAEDVRVTPRPHPLSHADLLLPKSEAAQPSIGGTGFYRFARVSDGDLFESQY